MFDDHLALGFLVVMVAGISSAILLVLMVKFIEKRDKRQAARKLNS
ncbi:MAG: hypothetical protein ONB44_02835 [candidate division KSB1 bacterium]|nr:hypothetical protein [candidate division KSB1 bacterium]MDZ7301061.1 hypothetical protein [candidate division KSB1 bacterium]MDZ7312115.1 hypothetical protein [candidate division KSB1 bacterium]